MSNKIFYGAGENARLNLRQWIKETGEPVCFADKDSRKWGKHFSDSLQMGNSVEGYEIISLIDAINKYPDYELYLTLANTNLLSVTEQLIGEGIPKERIHYFEDVEYRRGCDIFGEYIYLSSFRIATCCAPYNKSIPYTDVVHSEDSVRRCIREFRQWINTTLELMRTDSPTDCDGCATLKWGYYPKNPKIKQVNVAGFANTTCNFRCIFCNQNDTVFKGSKQLLDGYDIHRILSDEFGDSIQYVVVDDGEISMLPHRDKLLNLIKEKGWGASILTNASVWNDDIAQILSKTSSCIQVSLDSGTAETFCKVKGINAFHKVVENLKRYAQTGGRIELKYILLPGLNDGFDDINGFLRIANDLKACRIYLSHDSANISKTSKSTEKTTTVTEQQFAMYTYFATRCKEVGLPVYYTDSFFTTSDCLRMNNLCGWMY
ncbi:hypothetical protein FACS1894216_11340 [Synergistales bacterium]|nr:hypothetical protein FACS1894216_11340 [Synergistales bacterium]